MELLLTIPYLAVGNKALYGFVDWIIAIVESDGQLVVSSLLDGQVYLPGLVAVCAHRLLCYHSH